MTCIARLRAGSASSSPPVPRSVLFLVLLIAGVAVLGGCARSPLSGPGEVLAEERAGFGRGAFRLLDERLREAHHRTAIPGGTLVVYRHNAPVYRRGFGTASGIDTLYDLGSLTKPLAGPVAVLEMERRGVLVEEARQVLAHRTGLSDEEEYEALLEAALYALRAELLTAGERRLAALEPAGSSVYTYSNTAYALLSLTYARGVEDPAGELGVRLAGLAGSREVSFRPDGNSRVVPSGRTRTGAVLRGRPYDPLADLLVSQFDIPPLHSGLFASADAVAGHFAGVLAATDTDEERARLRSWLFEEVTERRDSRTDRRLYAGEGGLHSPTGRPWAPEGARPGHFFVQTGYTGCLLWVDIEREIVMALLTNASMTYAREEWREFGAEIVRALHAGAQ